jgi:hypothetical protein
MIEFYKTSIEPSKSVIASYAAFREPYKSIIGFYYFVIAFYTAFIATDKQGVRRHKDIYMEYYIPTKEADFVEWSGNLIAVSKANSSVWDLPEDRITELETLHVQFKALYEQCQTPSHTALDIQAKKELKTELIDKERHFVRFHLQNNEKMTDNGREALRIPIYDKTPTHHPPPDSHPIITSSSKNPYELMLHIHDSESGKRAKPEHANGAVLFWSVSETVITNPEDLKTSLLVTRTPHIMRFPPPDRGKILYIAGRWQNGVGEKGPWGEIVSAVIP